MQDLVQLLQEFNNLQLQEPQSADQINEILKQIDNQLTIIQNDGNYKLYGFYQYYIAEQCVSQINILTENQKVRYKNQLDVFKKIYDEFVNELEKSLPLTTEQTQVIEYKKLLLQRQKDQGTYKLVTVANTMKSAIIIKISAELSNQTLKAASKLKTLVTNTVNTMKVAKQKFNIIATLSIAALEACKIYWDYKKLKERLLTQEQKEEALQNFKSQLKALGARNISSFCITTTFSIAGATLGSLFPIIGTCVGGVLGSIVGGICSYFIEKYYVDPYFLEQNNNISEYEREIGLENFKIYNNGQDYTKEEFDFKYKKCLLIEHPDKQLTDTLKAVAREKIFKIQMAKEMIYKHRGWVTG